MKKESKIPKIKRNIKAFLNSEEGKITKKSVIKAGIVLGTIGAAMSHLNQADAHTNSIHNNAGTGSHTSHGSHGSHGSHASGCSSSSW